jgi:hypothetical protein
MSLRERTRLGRRSLVIQLSAVTIIMFAIGGSINAKWSDLHSALPY